MPVMHRTLLLLVLTASPAMGAAPEPVRLAAVAAPRAPAMPMGYPTLFMGPPRGSFPAVPTRGAIPTAPEQGRPSGGSPAGGPTQLGLAVAGVAAGGALANVASGALASAAGGARANAAGGALASAAGGAGGSPAGAAGSAPAGNLCRPAIVAAERDNGVPAHLLAAIGRVESGRRDPETGRFAPWPWTINAEGRGNFFPNKAAAIAAVRQLQAEGVRSIDVGCMQVNLRHHPGAFANLEEAFDPLTNARYAGRFLRELQVELGDWNRAAAAYHSRSAGFAGPYQAKVLAAWADEQRNPPPATPLLASVGSSPIRPVMAGVGGGTLLSNNAERAQFLPAAAPGGGRGLDAYRSAPIAAIGRMPVVFNGPHRRL